MSVFFQVRGLRFCGGCYFGAYPFVLMGVHSIALNKLAWFSFSYRISIWLWGLVISLWFILYIYEESQLKVLSSEMDPAEIRLIR